MSKLGTAAGRLNAAIRLPPARSAGLWVRRDWEPVGNNGIVHEALSALASAPKLPFWRVAHVWSPSHGLSGSALLALAALTPGRNAGLANAAPSTVLARAARRFQC